MQGIIPKNLNEATSYILSLTGEEREKALSSLPQYTLEEEFITSITSNPELHNFVNHLITDDFKIEEAEYAFSIFDEEFILKVLLLSPPEDRRPNIDIMRCKRLTMESLKNISSYQKVIQGIEDFYNENCDDEEAKLNFKIVLDSILTEEISFPLSRNAESLSYKFLCNICRNFFERLLEPRVFETMRGSFFIKINKSLNSVPEGLKEETAKALLHDINRQSILSVTYFNSLNFERFPQNIDLEIAKDFFTPIKQYLLTFIASDSNKAHSKVIGKQGSRTFVQLEWQGSLKEGANQLPGLFEALVKAKYIDCSQEVFFGVFSPYTFIEPVRWLTDNASELIFFILELQENEFLPKPKRQDWETLRKLFVKSDGSLYTEEFKQLKTNLKFNLSQTKKDSILKIIQSID